ncbi:MULTISPECIES: hypothetical protein [Ochrobactrum]|jgi:hypothetical protein|nr:MULTISPECIES: hypothetical protein [Brucella/Ochrobactrum group]MDH7792325.1 hypothetical protein [Ochrobactrum sp. AN78]
MHKDISFGAKALAMIDRSDETNVDGWMIPLRGFFVPEDGGPDA